MDQRVFLRFAAIALAATTLAGCGRKGPLELPAAAPPQSQAASEATQERVLPPEDSPGLVQVPNRYQEQPVGQKLDAATKSPSRPINAPAAPANKPFFLDPLL